MELQYEATVQSYSPWLQNIDRTHLNYGATVRRGNAKKHLNSTREMLHPYMDTSGTTR